MKKRTKILVGFLVLIVFLEIAFLAYLIFEKAGKDDLVDDQNSVEVQQTDQDQETEDSENETGNQKDDESEDFEESEFEYSYVTRAVVYEPDSDTYLGYILCNDIDSSCTMYGVEKTNNTEHVIDEKYVLSFNEYECSGAAAGTTYCEIFGEVKVEDFGD